MPGNKRPSRKPHKKRPSQDAAGNPGGHNPDEKPRAGGKPFGSAKGGRGFTSPAATARGSARGR